MGPRAGTTGKKKVPRRQASLQNKPVIPVRGKLGKLQKSRKHGKKIKTVESSTVDAYEEESLKASEKAKVRVQSEHVNAKPKSLDQEIPSSLRRLMKLKEETVKMSAMSQSQIKKFKAKKTQAHRDFNARMLSDTTGDEEKNGVPLFQRGQGESMKAFRSRVEQESNEFMKQTKYEDSNNCKLVKNKDGSIEVQQKKNRKKEKLAERRKLRKEKLKEKKEAPHHRDFSDLQDHVEFGEVSHRPPDFNAKPRKAEDKKAKGDKLKSLKLMGILTNDSTTTTGSVSKKMDPLKSMAYKHKMMEERQRAIDMYRTMKSKKYATT